MSLPAFSTQSELFSTAGLSASLFPETDRYRLFATVVYPHLVQARPTLERCYCAENGRTALEPVLMMGVSLLQERLVASGNSEHRRSGRGDLP